MIHALESLFIFEDISAKWLKEGDYLVKYAGD
jgi:hypothetical protein